MDSGFENFIFLRSRSKRYVNKVRGIFRPVGKRRENRRPVQACGQMVSCVLFCTRGIRASAVGRTLIPSHLPCVNNKTSYCSFSFSANQNSWKGFFGHSTKKGPHELPSNFGPLRGMYATYIVGIKDGRRGPNLGRKSKGTKIIWETRQCFFCLSIRILRRLTQLGGSSTEETSKKCQGFLAKYSKIEKQGRPSDKSIWHSLLSFIKRKTQSQILSFTLCFSIAIINQVTPKSWSHSTSAITFYCFSIERNTFSLLHCFHPPIEIDSASE